MRGEQAALGAKRVAANGYHYVKTGKGQTGWELRHHIVAQEKYGREVDTKIERVIFVDRNKENFDPDNIEVVPKKGVTNETKKARLDARIEELQAQRAALDQEEVAS